MEKKNYGYEDLSKNARYVCDVMMINYMFKDGKILPEKGRTIVYNDGIVCNIFYFNKDFLWDVRLFNLTPREAHAALWWFVKNTYGNASGKPGFEDNVESLNGVDTNGVKWGTIDYQNETDYGYLLNN